MNNFYKYIYKRHNGYQILKNNEAYGWYEDITDALYDRDRLVEVDWDIQTWCELPERENPYKHMRLPPYGLDRHRQYVYPTLQGTFRIIKTVDGVKKYFGSYKTLDEALDKRDELIKRGWET
jgi:hypothetical protein